VRRTITVTQDRNTTQDATRRSFSAVLEELTELEQELRSDPATKALGWAIDGIIEGYHGERPNVPADPAYVSTYQQGYDLGVAVAVKDDLPLELAAHGSDCFCSECQLLKAQRRWDLNQRTGGSLGITGPRPTRGSGRITRGS
jgi:hypothetical protein